jgi:aldehyde:ferredoxin oxidoreductase
VGESSLGGYFATPLKLAGYDWIILNGKTPSQTILEINVLDHRVSIQSAENLWGLDTYQTDKALRRQYSRSIHTACIGPAGERQVPMATIVHDRHYIAARTGMGAVMGSKNLKAIIAFAKGKVELADPTSYKALRAECVDILQEDYWAQRRKDLGTIGNLKWAIETNRAPSKNWQDIDWMDGAEEITGETLANTFLTGNRTCHACPVVCKRVVEVDQGPFAMEDGPGPEYETGIALGAMLLNDDLPALLKANDLCNRLGLDSISVGGTLAWALEAFEKGLLSDKDLDGKPFRWGDADRILEIISQIGLCEGKAGSLLSQGSAAASKEIGEASQAFTVHVKGLELGYHHPRAARGMEITFATNPRGAVHTEAPNVFGLEATDYQDWIKQVATTADQSSLPNSYVLCMFNTGPLGVPFMGKVVNSVTGQDWDEERLTLCAERGWYLKRIFNFLCGAGLEADTLPKRIRTQLQEAEIDHIDFDRALKLYWDYRQLGSDGFPSIHKLKELGLEEITDQLKTRVSDAEN